MTDVKITEYTELTTPAEDDVLEIVDDTAGTPVSRKIKLSTLLNTRLNYSLVASDLTLTAGTGLQAALPTTGDVFTLAANTTYEFEGIYYISKSGTTCTTALAFALSGATATFMAYHALAQNVAVNTAGATLSGLWVNQVAATVVNTTASGEVVIKFKGLLRVGTGGTVTPQIQFSAAPTTPVMKPGSYIKFTPIGTTNNIQGAVA